MWGFNIGSIVAGAGRRQLECFNTKRKILIIRIVDKESVVDGLLQTLCFITSRYKWTSISSSSTLFNTSSLG